jgi:hypothetical protein
MLKIELWGKKKLGYSFSTIIGGRQIVAIIVLKSGLARRVDPGPGTRDPGLELGQVEEKTREGKTQCDPADLAGWPGKTQSRPGYKPVDFCFFCFFSLKQRHFNFKKNWSGQNQEPGPRTGPATRPGLKTLVAMTVVHSIHQKKNVKHPMLQTHTCLNFPHVTSLIGPENIFVYNLK